MKFEEKEQLCIVSKQLIKKIEEKLVEWESSIVESNITFKTELTEENCTEIIDQANKETMLSLELEKSDRNNKVLKEIRNALKKIKQGTYGICEESGEMIDENRLIANPLARFSLEAQQELEMEMRMRKRS
jgi:DnaK suppressor protein